jgi:hypothetical protein
MPTSTPALGEPQTRWPARKLASRNSHPPSEWRCTGCDKLLGVRREGRMHIRFARAHEYLAGFPVTATCRGCGTLNQALASAR